MPVASPTLPHSTYTYTAPASSLKPSDLHMGVPRSRCSTPWSHHAFCLLRTSSLHPTISLILTPSLPPPQPHATSTLGIPRSPCSTSWSHHAFCPTTYLISCLRPILDPSPTATPGKPPHRDSTMHFLFLPGVGGTGRQP